jgi:hypothetical protein
MSATPRKLTSANFDRLLSAASGPEMAVFALPLHNAQIGVRLDVEPRLDEAEILPHVDVSPAVHRDCE